MLKANKTLTMVDLSDNEIGGRPAESKDECDQHGETVPTPEGPAALADGLKANSTVQELDVSANRLGPDGGKAIATSIAENSTITSVSQQQYAFFISFF